MQLQIEGIYDQRTMKCLVEEGIRRFVFDLRPTSFNFYQHHRFFDLLDHFVNQNGDFVLHFCNEADFVIKKFIDDLKQLENLHPNKNFSLLFSDMQSATFYDQFDMGYAVFYRRDFSSTFWRDARNLQQIYFSFDFVQELHQSNGLMAFIQNFSHLIGGRDIPLTLCLDWNSNIFPSLFSYFDFDTLSFPINSKVETCYRNVDLNLLRKQLHFCRQMAQE